MLTLNLPVRPLVRFVIVYCSVSLRCSDSLPCGEEMTARFYWDTL
jgi:hypothetical protein